MKRKTDIEKLWNEHVRLLYWAFLAIGAVCMVSSVALGPRLTLLRDVLREIGLILVPTALLSLLYQAYADLRLATHVADHVVNRIHDLIAGQTEVVATHKSRGVKSLPAYFSEAEERICILTTNLNSLTHVAGTLVERADKGISVRVLTLDPRHEFVHRRFSELKYVTEVEFSDKMFLALKEFCIDADRVKPEKRDNFQIKVYHNSPSVMLFVRDDRLMLGFVLRQTFGRDLMHVEFTCPTRPDCPPSCQCLLDHFDLLWEEATKVTSVNVDAYKWTCGLSDAYAKLDQTFVPKHRA